jgi:nucleotide-binding universal stress UspA family protein
MNRRRLRILPTLRRACAKTGVQAETRLLHGDAARALTAAAHQDQTAMMVVTSHGMSGLGSRVFGSVAQKILAHAPCPVLVVPCSEADLIVEEELEEQIADQALVGGMEAAVKARGR